MNEPELDQASQVDGGDAGREAHLVLLDAAESDAPVTVTSGWSGKTLRPVTTSST